MVLRFTEGSVIQTTERIDLEADLSMRNLGEVRNGVQRFHIQYILYIHVVIGVCTALYRLP